MRRRWLLSCVLMIGGFGCENNGSGPQPDAGEEHDSGADGADGAENADGDAGGDGHSEDAGADGDAGEPGQDGPLLEREPRDPLACSVATPLRGYEDRSWSYTGSALATAADGSVWIARIEGDGSDHHNPTDKAFLLSTIAEDGTPGASTTIPVADINTAYRPAMVALPGGGMALAWSEDDALRFATFDAAGDPVVAPKTLLDGLGTGVWPALALSTQGHLGIAWLDQPDFSQPGVLSFLALDTQGVASGEAVEVGAGTPGAPPGLVAAPDGGFALLWMAGGPYPEPFHVAFATVAANGSVAVEARQVSSAADAEGEVTVSGFASFGGALAAVEDGYVAAWSEGEQGWETFEGAYQVVRLRKIGSDGSLSEPPVTLRERVIDSDEVEPRFVPFGDTLGLLWGRGTHIYICAGCVPDNGLQFVLLDPSDLTPRSNVVQLPPDAEWGGGLLRAAAAVSGDTLFVTPEVTFHTWQEPSFAAFRCE